MGKFIVIEGIDASGKTTVAKLAVEMLAEKGLKCTYASRKTPKTGEVEEDDYLTRLSEIVWAESFYQQPWTFLSSDQWAQQMILWYSVLYSLYISPLCQFNDVVLIDGWFYKMYCRFLLDHRVTPKLIYPFFSHLDVADTVYMLLASPEKCWIRRDGNFKRTEIAPYQSTIGNAYSDFITHQLDVQQQLLKLARDDKWYIIEEKEDSAEKIAAKIVNHIITCNA